MAICGRVESALMPGLEIVAFRGGPPGISRVDQPATENPSTENKMPVSRNWSSPAMAIFRFETLTPAYRLASKCVFKHSSATCSAIRAAGKHASG
jgi:hypothetical protein